MKQIFIGLTFLLLSPIIVPLGLFIDFIRMLYLIGDAIMDLLSRIQK